jgi:hypothetical protein
MKVRAKRYEFLSEGTKCSKTDCGGYIYLVDMLTTVQLYILNG